MAFLKPNLPEDKVCLVKMISRDGQKEGDFGPKFLYKVEWEGKVYDHEATMTEEKKLQGFNSGDVLTVTKKKNTYGKFSLYWDKASGPSADTLKSAPLPTEEKDPDWNAIAVSKIMHNFVRDAYNKGVPPEQCHEVAAKLYIAQQRAEQMMQKPEN